MGKIDRGLLRSEVSLNGQALISLFRSQTVFIGLIVLAVLSLYVNQAPHNFAVSLLTVFSIFFLATHRKDFLFLLRANLFFSVALLAYFSLYVLLNLYHFSDDLEGLSYAIRRSRWLLYSFTILPAAVILFTQQKTMSLKNLKALKVTVFVFFGVLLVLILLDSYSRFFYLTPSTSVFFKSSLNNVFRGRAAWTYNPIPFSKMAFFASLSFGCLALNLKSFFERGVALIFSVAFLGVVIATQTRASWLGIILVVPLVFLLIKKSRGAVIVIVALSAVAFYSTPGDLVVKRLQSISTNASSFSNTYRMEHWKANIKLLQDNFIIGVGYGANRKPEVISPYLKRFTEDESLLYGHPHNEYLDVLNGMGVFLLPLFLVILFFPLQQNYKLIKREVGLQTYHVLVLSSLYLMFLFFTALFDKITLTSWSTVLICWGLSFYYKNKLKASC